MRPEKWWTPDTIFVTVMGLAMTIVLAGGIMLRPHNRQTGSGSALVPAAALQKARAERQECETMKTDMDRNLHANTHC